MNQEPTTTTTPTQHTALYRHTGCEQWGLAILAWESDDKRAYQFQDGKLRIFGRGYYHFFEEIDRPLDRTADIVSTLERGLDVSNARLDARRTARGGDRATVSGTPFAKQVGLFERNYDGGFSGEMWQRKQRGAGAQRRLKRHREPAVEHARELLSRSALNQLIEDGQSDEVLSRIIRLLSATDLVTQAQIKPIANATGGRAHAFALALRGLLYGEDPYMMRFEQYVAALARVIGKEPSWQLATALPALVHPGDHICIRPTVFRAQAAWMGPRIAYVKRPNAPLYKRYLTMAQQVARELRDAGHAPRDLLDVYSFMCVTLTPAAQKEYAAVSSSAPDRA